MKTEDIAVLALAGVAVYLILKKGGVIGQAKAVQVSPGEWSYNAGADGALFSASGADIRARR
jgi:hypothetical protein